MKKSIEVKKIRKYSIFAVGFGLFLCVPAVASSYIMNVFILGMTTYLCVLSVYVLLGMCGQNSFAQSGFLGVGAYVTANMLMKFNLPPVLCIIISILLTGLLTFILGFPLFRLRMFYFTFATIGVLTILTSLFTNWTPVTGGVLGIKDIPEFSIFGIVWSGNAMYFYLYFVLSLIAYIGVRLVYNSRLGRSFMAIRDNELSANCMGINSLLTKSIAFGISGMICGLAGSMYAFYQGYLSYFAFTFNNSVLFLIMIMLGGTRSPAGALIGSAIILFLGELLRPLDNYMLLIYGLGIIVLMIFQQEGILGGVKVLHDRYQKRKEARNEN